MRAVFRSADSMENSMRYYWGSSGLSSGNSGSVAPTPFNTTMGANFNRTHLMPVLKLLVEILTLHVWHDLH